MPDPRQQPEGATNSWIFLPRAPAGDWFRPVSSSFLVQRTKLLTPSVDHLPVFKVTWTTTTEPQFARSLSLRQCDFFLFWKYIFDLLRKILVTCFTQCAATMDVIFTRASAVNNDTGGISRPHLFSSWRNSMLFAAGTLTCCDLLEVIVERSVR